MLENRKKMYAAKISRLTKLISEGKNVEDFESYVAESIEEFVREDDFYSLPTDEILRIIGKSNIEDTELLCEIISKMSETKKINALLLLGVINPENVTLEECIKVISQFKISPICKRLGRLFVEKAKMPEVDYLHEIKELEKKTYIFEEEYLNVFKYFYEECHAIVPYEAINDAAKYGHLETIKYIYETCQSIIPCDAINDAAENGQFEVVKYLYETCHSKITEKTITKALTKEIKEYLISMYKANKESGD